MVFSRGKIHVISVVFQINMKKIIFYISIILIIVVGILFTNSQFADTPVPPTVVTNVPLPINISNTLYPDTTTYVAAKNGTRVPVRDFLQDPRADNSFDETVYVLADSVTAEGRVLYEIFYFTTDNTIAISLQDDNFAFARLSAENEIRSVLGLSDAELCDLEIRVTIPRFASEELSGQDVGLSFCPNSVNL